MKQKHLDVQNINPIMFAYLMQIIWNELQAT